MNKNSVQNIAYNVIHPKQTGCGGAHLQLGKILNFSVFKIFGVAQNVKYVLNLHRIKLFDKSKCTIKVTESQKTIAESINDVTLSTFPQLHITSLAYSVNIWPSRMVTLYASSTVYLFDWESLMRGFRGLDSLLRGSH